jgi:hypothetical protein
VKETHIHIHIGHNDLGRPPAGEVGCVEGIDDAARYLAEELFQIQQDYLERCFQDCDQQHPDRSRLCMSCEIADAALADRGKDSPVWDRLRAEQAWSALYGPHNHPLLHVWALPAVGDRRHCPIPSHRAVP